MKGKEILNLSLSDAKDKLDLLHKEFMDFRFKRAVGNASQPSLYRRSLKRNIARLKTIIGEYERGERG